MKKILLFPLFLFLIFFVFLLNPSSASAQTCTPSTTRNLTNISGVNSYYNYSTGGCTNVAGGNYNNVYSGSSSTTSTGQTAIVNCGTTGSGIRYHDSSNCGGTVMAYSSGACQSQTVSCTAQCMLNGNPVSPGTQYCVGQSWNGSNVCTTSNQYGTCQSDGTWTTDTCSPSSYVCAYNPSSTDVNCYNPAPGSNTICSAPSTPTPTTASQVCSCWRCVSGSCQPFTVTGGTCASQGGTTDSTCGGSCGGGR